RPFGRYRLNVAPGSGAATWVGPVNPAAAVRLHRRRPDSLQQRRRPSNPPEPPVSSSLLDKREARIRRMFGDIAPRYDLLHHLLSLNIDHYWRWRTTRLVPPCGTTPILDLCTGTGDLALAYDHRAGHSVPIIGAD